MNDGITPDYGCFQNTLDMGHTNWGKVCFFAKFLNHDFQTQKRIDFAFFL